MALPYPMVVCVEGNRPGLCRAPPSPAPPRLLCGGQQDGQMLSALDCAPCGLDRCLITQSVRYHRYLPLRPGNLHTLQPQSRLLPVPHQMFLLWPRLHSCFRSRTLVSSWRLLMARCLRACQGRPWRYPCHYLRLLCRPLVWHRLLSHRICSSEFSYAAWVPHVDPYLWSSPDWPWRYDIRVAGCCRYGAPGWVAYRGPVWTSQFASVTGIAIFIGLAVTESGSPGCWCVPGEPVPLVWHFTNVWWSFVSRLAGHFSGIITTCLG